MAIPSFSEQAIVHGIATGLRPRNDVVTFGWFFWIGGPEGRTKSLPPGVVLRAANHKSNDCRGQSHHNS